MNLIYDVIDTLREPKIKFRKSFDDLKSTEKIAVDFMANEIINEFILNDGGCREDAELFETTSDYISWQNDMAVSAEWVTRVRVNDTDYVFDQAYISINGNLMLVVVKVDGIYDDDSIVFERAEKAEKIYFNVRY